MGVLEAGKVGRLPRSHDSALGDFAMEETIRLKKLGLRTMLLKIFETKTCDRIRTSYFLFNLRFAIVNNLTRLIYH